jgi:hypothetical protein
MPSELRTGGIGVHIDLERVSFAMVERVGVRWKVFHWNSSPLSANASLGHRALETNECLEKIDERPHPWPISWFAIREPWGILVGSGRQNKSDRDGRRLAVLFGQVMAWSVQRGCEPVLFEPSEICRGFGAPEAEFARLRRCATEMIDAPWREADDGQVWAATTAVMGGRSQFVPEALRKRQ